MIHISITSMMPLYKLSDAIDDVIMARLDYVTVLNYVMIAKKWPFSSTLDAQFISIIHCSHTCNTITIYHKAHFSIQKFQECLN